MQKNDYLDKDNMYGEYVVKRLTCSALRESEFVPKRWVGGEDFGEGANPYSGYKMGNANRNVISKSHDHRAKKRFIGVNKMRMKTPHNDTGRERHPQIPGQQSQG